MESGKKVSTNKTNTHLTNSRSCSRRRLIINQKMTSAPPYSINSVGMVDGVGGCRERKKRDIKVKAFTEVAKEPRNLESKMGDENPNLSEAAGPSSSSSYLYEGQRGGSPLGVMVAGCEGEDEESSLPGLSHGFISVIGRSRVMEDSVTVAPGLVVVDEFGSYDFFAVYDGHGGSRVANACRDRMHQLVAEEVEKGRSDGGGGVLKGVEYWEKVMRACFRKMDEEVGGMEAGIGEKASSVKTVGSTAVVMMVGTKEIVVANCGDSRAVLCRGGVAVPLSRDHKPDRPDERERVEAAGGRVVDWNGSRVLGILATSRSIGM